MTDIGSGGGGITGVVIGTMTVDVGAAESIISVLADLEIEDIEEFEFVLLLAGSFGAVSAAVCVVGTVDGVDTVSVTDVADNGATVVGGVTDAAVFGADTA